MSEAAQEQATTPDVEVDITQPKPKKQRKPSPPNPNADLAHALFEDLKIVSLAFAKRLSQLRKLAASTSATNATVPADSVFDELLAFDKEYTTGLHTRFTDATKKQPMNVRPKRDADAPSGPKNAFLCYSNSPEIIADILERFPDIKKKQPEIVSKIAAQWAKMTPAEKVVYEEQARQDKIRHAAEIAVYTAANAANAVTGSSGSTIVTPARAKRSRAKKPADLETVPDAPVAADPVVAADPPAQEAAKTKRSRSKKAAP